MAQIATIQRVKRHLRRIESELVAIRQELTELAEPQSPLSPLDVTGLFTGVNKAALREQMQHLFLTLSVHGEPVGVETLQKRMHEAKLTPNELSQSIIAARED